jgi:rhodanese-related sulfurtransferase
MIPEVSVQMLSDLINNNEKITILDVREPWEYQICSIKDSINIPLRKIEDRFDEIPQNTPVYVLCHHGKRSLNASDALIRAGLEHVYNITGGIDAWARTIEPSMPRY